MCSYFGSVVIMWGFLIFFFWRGGGGYEFLLQLITKKVNSKTFFNYNSNAFFQNEFSFSQTVYSLLAFRRRVFSKPFKSEISIIIGVHYSGQVICHILCTVV